MPTKKVVFRQPSWRLVSRDVEAYVSQIGGQIAPVVFDRRRRKISPFSIAPWWNEKLAKNTPPIIRVLRGDFFCMPFGGNATPYRGEKHPLHGQTANAKWKLESLNRSEGETTLHLSLRAKIRAGRIDKTITLRDGENALYCRHLISQMTGPMCLGHHAMLKFPDEPGSGVISTSPFVHGQVFPLPMEYPDQKGYSLLTPGAKFDSLQSVPTITGQTTDLTRYPARRGFEDLVMIVADRSAPIAWTAVWFPKQKFVWLALKNPRQLASTIFWISNGGRHYAPWNGRHVNVMGIEDVTANFHFGLSQSANPNEISALGHPTSINLNPNHPQTISYIMAALPAPKNLGQVTSIEPDAAGDFLTIRGQNGQAFDAAVNTRFLRDGE
jgi:hypothetical protein